MSKHSIVSHRSPAKASGIFLCPKGQKKTPPVSGWWSTSRRRYEAKRSLCSSGACFGTCLATNLDVGKKKRPPVTGRRSNYAHLTDINLQAPRHSFVKRVHRVFTARSVYYSCVPHPARNIQTSAGHNGLPTIGTMCKHSVRLI